MEMQIKDFNLVLAQYDNKFLALNRELILVSAYAEELKKENEALKKQLEEKQSK